MYMIFVQLKALREKENALEALADRELTIVKFRELVQKLQDQCQELQTQLQKESISHDSMKMSIPEMLDFKVCFKCPFSIVFRPLVEIFHDLCDFRKCSRRPKHKRGR